MNEKTARLKYMTAVLLFGINPIFIRYTDIPSEAVALLRAFLGLGTLFVIYKVTGRRLDKESVKEKLPVLILSGLSLGVNWISLFEGYAIMKVSVASLFNYMAPIIAVALSPLVLKEKLTLKQVLCVITAFVGIILVSGVLEPGDTNLTGRGILMGVLSCASFVCIIFCNKRLKSLNSYDSVVMQLFFTLPIMLPYVLINDGGIPLPGNALSVFMILFVGIVNSGFVYLFYYGPMPYLPVQSIAIIGYLEPVMCIILSVFLFKEPMSLFGAIGAVLIIGATAVSELKK